MFLFFCSSYLPLQSLSGADSLYSWIYCFELRIFLYKVYRAGLYMFHMSALSQKDKLVWIELIHNDALVASVYTNIRNAYSGASKKL
ncbi:hypothetical protein RRG08_058109 [Elysia crispata]|uniref:Uncharacterized protein n=1 Tax=Elysia crispata TaxID=231223 RepID=A0AAE1D7R9_9GAST|nr:hypothetical protein RRG08_058109 [Elysia crispata]